MQAFFPVIFVGLLSLCLAPVAAFAAGGTYDQYTEEEIAAVAGLERVNGFLVSRGAPVYKSLDKLHSELWPVAIKSFDRLVREKKISVVP